MGKKRRKSYEMCGAKVIKHSNPKEGSTAGEADGECTAERFQIPGKVQFHLADGEDATIASIRGFASAALCDELVALCEGVGFRAGDASASDYRQATVDLEVDAQPVLRRWLTARGLVSAVSRAMLSTHGATPVAFDDVFIVKYDAAVQRRLERHVDAGDVSFMLALSSPSDYKGGGTSFDVLGDTRVEAAQGQLLLFNAALYHSGLPISRGRRYLLVGFAHTFPGATRIPGNVGLDLKALRGSGSAFELWSLVNHEPTRKLLDEARELYRQLANESRWVGAYETDAADSLADFAQRVFWFHANRLGMSASVTRQGGAEFWVQCLETAADSTKPGQRISEGGDAIPWHYDKDEAHFRDTEQLRFPAVATVTYLTTGGAPTVVFGRNNTMIVYPRAGNHLAFAGHLLHGCPNSLATSDQTELAPNYYCAQSEALRNTRVTLLVNLWPHEPPKDCTMIARRLRDVLPDAASCELAEPLEGTLAAWREIRVRQPALTAEGDDNGKSGGISDPDQLLRQIRSSYRPVIGSAVAAMSARHHPDALIFV